MPYININAKQAIEKIRAKTIKLLEENIGKKFYDLSVGKGFLNRTQKI